MKTAETVILKTGIVVEYIDGMHYWNDMETYLKGLELYSVNGQLLGEF